MSTPLTSSLTSSLTKSLARSLTTPLGGPLGLVLRVAAAACIAASSYIHADLYINNGYRYIHGVGPSFLLQASAGFAVAVLLLAGDALVVRLLAAGVAAGALGGFVLSRTVGVFGFTETGFTPAPQAAISVAVEVAALALIATMQVTGFLLARAEGPVVRVRTPGTVGLE